MIDFIHIEINDKTLFDKISVNPLLEYKKENTYLHKPTGELPINIIKVYKNLEFTFNSKQIKIKGSLHKYHNNGLHNANDFSFIDLKNSLNELNQLFEIEPEKCVLHSFEFGVNIQPANFKTFDIYQNVFYHSADKRRIKFIEPIQKRYKQAGTYQNNFALKLYDKHFQYPEYTNGELMRFEIKYFRMRELNNKGIHTLADLLNIENHLFLRTELIKRFNEILFYDFTIKTKKLTKKDQLIIKDYANPNFWDNLILDEKRNKFSKTKKHLQFLIDNHSENIQNTLLQIIENKTIRLLNVSKYEIKKGAYTHTFTSKNKGAYTHLYIGGICTPIPYNKTNKDDTLKKEVKTKCNKILHSKKRCSITEIDISNQKENSLTLSFTGLRYLYQNDKTTFEKIKKRFLTNYWSGADIEIQIKEIAHNIRNAKNNSNYKQMRMYPTHQRTLFELNTINP